MNRAPTDRIPSRGAGGLIKTGNAKTRPIDPANLAADLGAGLTQLCPKHE